MITDKIGHTASLRAAAAGIAILCIGGAAATDALATPVNAADGIRDISIANNQPFPIRMPVRIPAEGLAGGTRCLNTGQTVQVDGQSLRFILDGPANGRMVSSLTQVKGPAPAPSLIAKPAADGLALSFAGQDLGAIQWDLLITPAPKKNETPFGGKWGVIRDAGEKQTETPVYQPDVRAHFHALPMAFTKKDEGPVFTRYEASATTGGLLLTVTADAYGSGFLELRAEVKNESRSATANVYCALACLWKQPDVTSRTLCYDNKPQPFLESAATPYRTGLGHHRALQRGTDWIDTVFRTGIDALWMNDFTESFAVRVQPTAKSPGRWSVSSQSQLGQEAQAEKGELLSVTEITRATIPRFSDRLRSYALFAPGESTVIETQVAFSQRADDNARPQDQFLAYTCHKSVTTGTHTKVDIGVPYVTFSTSYFPFSTLGENFGRMKLAGQDREGYWPLSADTVTQLDKVKPDIARDLRIAKAMGFDVIRLHHLELLNPLDMPTRAKYLDFLFGQLRDLGLTAMIDIQLTAEEAVDVVGRYRDVISGVEVENEILIWGMKDGRLDYWNSIYEPVKRTAPEIPIHMTAHSNCGIFTKLFELGGHSDKIGFHSYTDGPSALGTGFNMALAVGNYASKMGRPAAITEWNWRFLTRMPFEERAKLYPQIVGDALRTRSIADFGQFQFVESLAMNPASITGIRHYEPLFLSRRPKPEAFELMKLIAEYGDKNAPVRRVRSNHPVVQLDSKGEGVMSFTVTNSSTRPLELAVSPEIPSFEPVQCALEDTKSGQFQSSAVKMRLLPGATHEFKAQLKAAPLSPGFYHVFLRMDEVRDGVPSLLSYAWGEARMAGEPTMTTANTTSTAYAGDLQAMAHVVAPETSVTVVYGANAAPLELESAVLIHNTLESATGREIALYNTSTLPAALRTANLVLVGSPESNPMIEKPKSVTQDSAVFLAAPNKLCITGVSPETVAEAAADFTLRYWRNAKDSMVRRLGTLTEKSLPKGADASKLP